MDRYIFHPCTIIALLIFAGLVLLLLPLVFLGIVGTAFLNLGSAGSGTWGPRWSPSGVRGPLMGSFSPA